MCIEIHHLSVKHTYFEMQNFDKCYYLFNQFNKQNKVKYCIFHQTMFIFTIKSWYVPTEKKV